MGKRWSRRWPATSEARNRERAGAALFDGETLDVLFAMGHASVPSRQRGDQRKEQTVRPWPASIASSLLLTLLLAAHPALAEVQLQCRGTLLEARGSAEQERPIARLRFFLSLEAEQRSSDGALALLDRKSTRLNSSHTVIRMPSSA